MKFCMNSMLLDALLMNLAISCPLLGGGGLSILWDGNNILDIYPLDLNFCKEAWLEKYAAFLKEVLHKLRRVTRQERIIHFGLMAAVIIKLAINTSKLLCIQLL